MGPFCLKRIILWSLKADPSDPEGWIWAGVLALSFAIKNIIGVHGLRVQESIGYSVLFGIVRIWIIFACLIEKYRSNWFSLKLCDYQAQLPGIMIWESL
jgi:hypothetical protein